MIFDKIKQTYLVPCRIYDLSAMFGFNVANVNQLQLLILSKLYRKYHKIFNVYLDPLSRNPLAKGLWSIFI